MSYRSGKRRVLIWEVTGIFFIIIAGSLLHFAYGWSGRSPIVGLFAPVNESVWEHLKLGFWSLFLYSVIEYWFIRRRAENFFVAKAAGILSLQLFIVAVFYTYTAFTIQEILAVDIGSYVVGAVICQVIAYNILTTRRLPAGLTVVGISFILLHAAALMVFTFRPPRLSIFKDSNTGQYGTSWRVDRSTDREATGNRQDRDSI